MPNKDSNKKEEISTSAKKIVREILDNKSIYALQVIGLVMLILIGTGIILLAGVFYYLFQL